VIFIWPGLKRHGHRSTVVRVRLQAREDLPRETPDLRLVGLVGDEQAQRAGGDRHLIRVEEEVVGRLGLLHRHANGFSSAAGTDVRWRSMRAKRPPAAPISIPKIAVTTANSGGKLPSETFAWVPAIVWASRRAVP
jgi:hypothetical protein